MTLAGADKLIGKEDRATLESVPSALSAVKQSAPASSNPDCFAAQSENSRRSRNPSAEEIERLDLEEYALRMEGIA